MGSSQTGGLTCAPCIGRQMLHHWATTAVLNECVLTWLMDYMLLKGLGEVHPGAALELCVEVQEGRVMGGVREGVVGQHEGSGKA